MTDAARDDLARALEELRPRLHRYCARMAGSAVDGEDIVQDAMVKALRARPAAGAVANLEGWLFRIAYHAALDFLRGRARRQMVHDDDALDMIAAPDAPDEGEEIVATSLRTFLRLPPLQRSAVILK